RDRPWRRWSSGLLAVAAGSIGVATLAQYVLGVDLGIDQVLANSPLAAEGAADRMSPTAAVAFVQVAAALVLLPSRRRSLALVGHTLALVASTIGALALIGHL